MIIMKSISYQLLFKILLLLWNTHLALRTRSDELKRLCMALKWLTSWLLSTPGAILNIPPVRVVARSSQWLSPEVYNIPKWQGRKCLSNSCLTFYLSGNECIKYIYASTDPEKETEAKDSKVTKQMRYCCLINILQFSCVFCLYTCYH